MTIGTTSPRRSRRGGRGSAKVTTPASAAVTPPSPPTAPAPKTKNAKDPLLSAICHDLRAPLAAVTMGTNFVLQTLSDDEENARARRILDAMLRSCAQMERLVRNFADLTEIEGHAVNLRLGMHDAGEMLQFAAEAAGEGARARSVTMEVDLPRTNIVVRCDRERLLRAFHHVVENAVKFAPDGSTVTLSVTAKNGDVAFTVLDRGPGLSAQVKKNLFDRQWHAKRANRVGAGFGLQIARGFAEAHGGRVVVESRAGTTEFGIVVPKEGPDEDEELSAAGEGAAPAPRRPVSAAKGPRR